MEDKQLYEQMEWRMKLNNSTVNRKDEGEKDEKAGLTTHTAN